jgi:hypothetical protein
MQNHPITPSSLRAGNLIKSASNGARTIVSEEDAVSLNFKRECMMGKQFGFPISDEILTQCLGFQMVMDDKFEKRTPDVVVVVEKRDEKYFVFGIHVEVAHILQGLFFYATGKELIAA